MTRKESIKLLTERGHTVAKAIEIALDAERGDWWAKAWIATMKSQPLAAQ